MSQQRRHDDEFSHATPAPAPAAPGRAPTTARLSPRAIVFRVESPEAARELGAAFGRRDGNGVAEGAEAAVTRAASSTGAPLPGPIQRQFEASLGADLGGVRVHTGADSAASAAAVGARAYTTGQDIHFAAGQYAPGDPFGLHLLAHEVAHTVQQSGGAAPAGAPQYKLDVSSPGDAAELEADHAADAMVAGQPASLAGSSPSVARKEEGAGGEAKKEGGGLPIVGGGFELSANHEWKEIELGYVKVTPSITGTLAFAPAAEAKGDPASVKAGVEQGKDGTSVKLAAEKKLGEGLWGFEPKLGGDVTIDKKGLHLSFGGALEHPGFDFHGAKIGPFSIEPKAFEWEPGKELKIAFVELSEGLSLPPGQFMGWKITPSITLKASFEPNWEKIAELIAEHVGAGILAEAGLVAAPFAWAVVGLVGWAKAGHEFDEVSSRIQALRKQCQMATDEALGGEHVALALPFGAGDANVGTTDIAQSIRASIASKLGVPEAALAAAAKKNPGLKNQLYLAAWKQTWPKLKDELLAHYQDTTFTSYTFERQWLESFETGEFAQGY